MHAQDVRSLPPVVIVDDDDDDRLLTQRALAAATVRNPVLALPTGIALRNYLTELNEVGREAPSLLLIDVRLRDCDGFDLAKWVRSHPEFEHVGIVMMSGAEPTQRWQMASALRVAYINKFPPRHVLSAILSFYCVTEEAHAAELAVLA